MPGELLMPLLSDEQPALRRLDGRQHAYVQQLTTNAVLNATMTPVFPAGGGPGDQMASRVHARGVLDDSGPQRVPVVQDSQSENRPVFPIWRRWLRNVNYLAV